MNKFNNNLAVRHFKPCDFVWCTRTITWLWPTAILYTDRTKKSSAISVVREHAISQWSHILMHMSCLLFWSAKRFSPQFSVNVHWNLAPCLALRDLRLRLIMSPDTHSSPTSLLQRCGARYYSLMCQSVYKLE